MAGTSNTYPGVIGNPGQAFGEPNPAAPTQFTSGLIAYPQMQSGRWYRLPNVVGLNTSNVLGIGTLRVLPKYIPNVLTLSALAAEVTTIGDAGSKFRIGIYADDGTFRPGSLVLDAGTIAGDSATMQSITISQQLTPDWYWFGGAVQLVTTTQPTMRTVSGVCEPDPIDYGTAGLPSQQTTWQAAMTGVTGALPSTFTFGNFSSGAATIFGLVA